MAYTTGILKDRVEILNRAQKTTGKYGIDSTGVQWTSAGVVWAEVTWAKGKQAMNAGALDAYALIMVRMRWNDKVTMRSRLVHGGQTYQVVPETFHVDKQANTIQLNAQLVIND